MTLSRLSGKNDYFDSVESRGADYMLRSKIYHKDKLLEINDERSLVLWYPYLITMSYATKEDAIIHLSAKDFITKEECEILDFYLEQMLKEQRRCKRKHEEFDVEKVYQKICCSIIPRPELKPLVERVAELGNKATYEGIYLPSAEYYRNEWRKELRKYGFEEEFIEKWIYRWRRDANGN